MAKLDSIGLRHGYANLEEVRLHYVEAGEGPVVVLLHGFPEFWFAWRRQIPALVEAGFRVVAPDMRGFNFSSRPAGVAQYSASRVAADVAQLIHERGTARSYVAGHDWGGVVAWAVAMSHADVVERLVVISAPHPRRLVQGMRRPEQLVRSWYVGMFQLPWVAERILSHNDWWLMRTVLKRDTRPGAFTSEDLERYVGAWSQPGAATSMINYYRAAARQRSRDVEARVQPVARIRSSSGVGATATSATSSVSRTVATFRISKAWFVFAMRLTGCRTTSPSGWQNCS